MFGRWRIARLGKTTPFPPPERADRDGLLATGGDLSVERLLEAYRRGDFKGAAGYFRRGQAGA